MYPISVMNENIENNDWKKEAPALAAIPRHHSFTVPNGYFESVEAHVKSTIFIKGLNEELNGDGFEVPQDYFENLTEHIETKIRLAEIPESESSFTVPEHYFDSLTQKITDRVAAERVIKTAKIVPLWRKNIIKYAGAACFVLMASFGAYFYQNSTSSISIPSQSADLTNEQLLYDIDENTIIEHLETHNTTTVNHISASDTEMENYLLSNFSSGDLSHELNN